MKSIEQLQGLKAHLTRLRSNRAIPDKVRTAIQGSIATIEWTMSDASSKDTIKDFVDQVIKEHRR